MFWSLCRWHEWHTAILSNRNMRDHETPINNHRRLTYFIAHISNDIWRHDFRAYRYVAIYCSISASYSLHWWSFFQHFPSCLLVLYPPRPCTIHRKALVVHHLHKISKKKKKKKKTTVFIISMIYLSAIPFFLLAPSDCAKNKNEHRITYDEISAPRLLQTFRLRI